MINTKEYIKKLSCPNCEKFGLSEVGHVIGTSNMNISLQCKYCNTHITSILIPDTESWIIHKDNQDKKEKDVFLWNQA